MSVVTFLVFAISLGTVGGLKCVCSKDYEDVKFQQQADFEEKVARIVALSDDGNCSLVEQHLSAEKNFLETQLGLNFSTIDTNLTSNGNTSICDNDELDIILKAMTDFYRLLASCVDGECDVQDSCENSIVCQEYSRHGHDVQRCFHAVTDGRDFRGCQIGPLPTFACQPNSTESAFDYTCDYNYCNRENQFERYCGVENLLV